MRLTNGTEEAEVVVLHVRMQLTKLEEEHPELYHRFVDACAGNTTPFTREQAMRLKQVRLLTPANKLTDCVRNIVQVTACAAPSHRP